MPPAWPEDEYLLQLGRVVYSVASIEGLSIFDLPRMPESVDGLMPGDLAGKTTTGIGNRLIELAPSIKDLMWRAYVERSGRALADLGPKRNSVLHSRPATIDGEQRLNRWRLQPTEVMPISMAHLEQLLDEIDAHRCAMNQLRPPLD